MKDATACIVLSDRTTAHALGGALQQLGLRVVAVPTVDAAIDTVRFTPPDVWLIGVEEARTVPNAVSTLTRNEEFGAIPGVALVKDGPDARRQALALGLGTHITLPCDDAELRLVMQAVLGTATELASPPIVGDLSTVQLSELVTMFHSEARPVSVTLESPDAQGRVVLNKGDIVDAVTSKGAGGDDAVEAMLSWRTGRFSAAVGHDASAEPLPGPAATAPPRPIEATTDLPVRSASSPPPALQSQTESSPLDDSAVQCVHECLAMLNALASFVVASVEPTIAMRKFEGTRRVVSRRRTVLEMFSVHPEGMVALSDVATIALQEVTPKDVISAVAEWVLAFRVDIDQSFPGTLPVGTLRVVADSASDNLRRRGLMKALGLDD